MASYQPPARNRNNSTARALTKHNGRSIFLPAVKGSHCKSSELLAYPVASLNSWHLSPHSYRTGIYWITNELTFDLFSVLLPAKEVP